MAVTEENIQAFSSLSSKKAEQETEKDVPDSVDADAQDEALWESKFAASQDTLARLAAQSRAHRSAGRTKKIGS